MVYLLLLPPKPPLLRYEDVDDRGESALVALVGHFWMRGEVLINRTTDDAHWMVGEDFLVFLKTFSFMTI